MSIGNVIGDAAQGSQQPVHPHNQGVQMQPGAMSPAQVMRAEPQLPDLTQRPDPNKPTMTPLEAQMQTSAPVEQTQADQATDTSVDQAIRGFGQAYARWEVVDAAHTTIKEAIEQSRRLPIIHFPVGVHGESAEPVLFELDLDEIIPAGLSEEDRGVFLARQFGAWNNYLVKEWKRLWLKMFFYLSQGCRQIDPEYLQGQAEQAMMQDPARLIALANQLVAQQSPPVPTQ